ncbi:hypothetical protein RclHR1_00550004 [Rhizophagus clarus]|uniref:DUF7431 domain-containing protein n=1 Tax=Rhizophagus clarus TaxID=94130 RepID=A0A2Z6SFS5_9GLOM|nr:hypothetical protein RclHR1_00550004 [Rhizophagus clarus]GES80256.1 hypothetical protein GLOIN_2v1497713 [Rhizophagus clarus]
MFFESVIIQIINGSSPQSISKKLNLEDKLSDIRNNDDDINDTLSFSTKLSDEEYAKVERENEKYYRLKEIITIEDDHYYLYLKINSYWKILNDNFKLDYGCTASYDGIMKANKRAFIMKDCELTNIGVEGYKKDQLKFERYFYCDWMMKTNLFISSDSSLWNFMRMGLKGDNLSKLYKNLDYEIMSVYKYTEIGKVLIKIRKNLEPTEEFIKEINEAINSDNSEKVFRRIMEEYGQFIPTEIILGGRVYFKDVVTEPSKVKISEFYNFNHVKILGGKHPESKKFNEKYWMESLNEYQNWDCIEFKNPVIIFRLLPEDMYKQIIFVIGKKILYKDCFAYPCNSGMTVCNLKEDASKIIQNKDSDCDIFATVFDTENSKDVVFNCQILKLKNAEPSILIRCIQKELQPRVFKLFIPFVVIGYDTDFRYIYSDDKFKVELRKFVYDTENCEFDSILLQRDLVSMISNGNLFFGIPILNNLNPSNESLVIGHNFRKTTNNEFKIDLFSYCTKTRRYVKLPKFAFCTFVTLTNDVINATFEFKKWGKPFINTYYTVYFSNLYLLNRDDYSPIFLCQNFRQINIEYVDCDCNKTCFICINKTKRISKNDQISCKIVDWYKL